MNRFSKIAAAATIALGAAAPMAMAQAFQTGTVTAVNRDHGTVVINGARYTLNSRAMALTNLQAGEQVLYKADRDDTTPQLVALKRAPGDLDAENSVDIAPYHSTRSPSGLNLTAPAHRLRGSDDVGMSAGVSGGLSAGVGGGLGSQNH